VTEFARCPAFNIECQYVTEVDRLSAENERLREALRSAIRNIENLTYDIKCHTECAECQSNVAMYEHAVEEYRAALGETK